MGGLPRDLQGDFGAAAALSEASEALWGEADYPAGVGYSLLVRGQASLESGKPDEGVVLLERSLGILRGFGDRWGQIRPLNSLAEAARAEGDFPTAVRLHREAMAIAEVIGDRLAQPAIGAGLARALWGTGRATEAAEVSASALRAALSFGNPVQTAAALEALALAGAVRDPGQAVRLWGAAAARRQLAGSPTEELRAAAR